MTLLDEPRLSHPQAPVVRNLVLNSYPVSPWNPTPVGSPRIATRPCFWLLLLALGGPCAVPLPALGQATVNDVHIQPREVDKATEEVAKETDVPSLSTHV